MHNFFIHRRDNVIVINGTEIPLSVLQTYDPEYTLPPRIVSRRYTHDPQTGDGYHFVHDGGRNLRAAHPDPQLEKYIANLPALQAIAESVQEETESIDRLIAQVSEPYTAKRKAEYPPIEDLVVALWELIVEGKQTANNRIQELQSQRLNTKEKFPNPIASSEKEIP
jgi:hypothetical protein